MNKKVIYALMALHKTHAIIIGLYPLGEADKIVVFYTRDYGKIRTVAKGARKLKNKLVGKLELLSYGILVYYERVNRDLHIINSFDVIETFQAIRENLLKIAYCSYIAELVQHVKLEGEIDPDTFDMMINIMSMMKTSNDPELITRVFELRLLEKLGFSPCLEFCAICTKDVKSLNVGFSVPNGGILCKDCSSLNAVSLYISRGTLELMKKMLQIQLDLIPRLRISQLNRLEIRRLLSGFILFHVDIGKLNSLEFLKSIETGDS